MPAIVDRMVKQLKARGKSTSEAFAIANSQQKKFGNITASGKATAKGEKRGEMTPAERARDRAAKDDGGALSDYRYNKKNNTAVKGRVNPKVKRRV